MRLYHGTIATALSSILTDGIRPRGEAAGNWERCPSKQDFVYLTRPYPLYFAMSAAGSSIPKDEAAAKEYAGETRLLILEVESEALIEDDLCPDEDFIAQAIMSNRTNHGILTGDTEIDRAGGLSELTNLIHPGEWRENWGASLDGMGQCCHFGTIPADAITRYALIDPAIAKHIVTESLEPTITVFNYKIMGAFYENLTAFIFGDSDRPPVNRAGFLYDNMHRTEADAAKFDEVVYGHLPQEERDRWKQINAERHAAMLEERAAGIEVVTVNHD